MATLLCWNGDCRPADQALIGADDRSFLAGEGAFETLRVQDGRPLALPWHLERLHGTLAWLGWPDRLGEATVRDAATTLLHGLGLTEARLRLTVSRRPDHPMDWLLQAAPYQGPDEAQRRQGVAVVSVPDVPHPRLPHKVTSRIAYSQVDRIAREAGAFEGLFCDDAHWLEGSRTNLLAVRGDYLLVGDGRVVLPGIARRAILKGAATVGLRPQHAAIPRWATPAIDGLFLTNSLIGVLPVRAVDGEAVAVPPEALAAVQEAYRLGMALADVEP